jgi:Ca-activated chloride channel family protein
MEEAALMSFAHPQILWLLLAFPPALLAFFWWSLRKRQQLMTRFIESRLLSGLVAGVSPARRKLRLALLLAGVVCIILALARPQWGFTWQEVKQKGVDIVVAIDTSKSMLAEDIAPNRLARAKLAALDLMQQARSDRLGLVAFAGDAFLQCPLTIDDAAFRQSVESLDVNTIPQGGTALSEAIHIAMTAFKEADNHKVLVLLTDGEDHDSNALDAAEKAAQAGLRIFTIGIGTPDGQILRIKDAQGHEDYLRDEQGNAVKSHLNERLLQEIAGASQGGFYLPLRGAKTMESLYEKGLASLPKSEHQEKLIRQYQDRYHWPLAIALVLLIAEALLPERKHVRRPRPAVAAANPALQTAAILLLFLPAARAGSPGSALREYNAGKYEQAMEDYGRLLQRNADDPRLHFNTGAAAYRNQKFDEAAKQFNDAIATPDLKLQSSAYYNHGNSMYRLGEALPDPAKRTEAWEKSLKDYELSMKLAPHDPDAKFNHDFVKQRLEELKQQQQQSKQDKSKDQNKQDQNQNQDQSQKQDQNQQQKNQQQQGQQNQSQQEQSQQSQSQKQDSSQNQQQQQAQQQQAEEDQKQQQAAKQQQQEQQQKQQQAQAAKPSEQSKEEKEKQDAAAYAAGQMTQEQAEQLLDAAKSEEKMLQPKSQGKPTERPRPLKDW